MPRTTKCSKTLRCKKPSLLASGEGQPIRWVMISRFLLYASRWRWVLVSIGLRLGSSWNFAICLIWYVYWGVYPPGIFGVLSHPVAVTSKGLSFYSRRYLRGHRTFTCHVTGWQLSIVPSIRKTLDDVYVCLEFWSYIIYIYISEAWSIFAVHISICKSSSYYLVSRHA